MPFISVLTLGTRVFCLFFMLSLPKVLPILFISSEKQFWLFFISVFQIF